MKSITVFTPTYDRAYILPRLFCSLQNQSFKDFEWLIIDDGSRDNTGELVHEWINEERTFSIRYYKIENGGKHRAINYALDLADGKLFFIVDSDDWLTCDALEKIDKWEKELPSAEKYCAIAGNMGTSTTDTPNSMFQSSYYDGTAFDMYTCIDGERAMVFYTEIHRKYRYPVFENEKFMTEAVTSNRMAHDGYKIRYYNDIIRIYEYLEDGLTKTGFQLFKENPRGYGLFQKELSAFRKDGIWKKHKLFYSFTCDLKDRYDDVLIADCIGANVGMIRFFRAINKIKSWLRGINCVEENI